MLSIKAQERKSPSCKSRLQALGKYQSARSGKAILLNHAKYQEQDTGKSYLLAHAEYQMSKKPQNRKAHLASLCQVSNAQEAGKPSC